jgi:hypothetical protein
MQGKVQGLFIHAGIRYKPALSPRFRRFHRRLTSTLFYWTDGAQDGMTAIKYRQLSYDAHCLDARAPESEKLADFAAATAVEDII